MADIEEFRRLLEQQQRRVLAEAQPQDGPAPPASPASGSPASLIAASVALDGPTRTLLAAVVGSNDPKKPGYSNADLAAELLDSEQPRLGEPGLTGTQRGVVQRLALVARIFGAVEDDRNLPAGFKTGFAALRFPLIKSALADPSFFNQRAHPLRILAGELVQRASETQLSGKHTDRRLEELLQSAARDFDLSAAFVRPALAKLGPLPAESIEQFLAQLKADQADREANRQRRARDVVGKVIQSRVLTTRLPQLVQFLIHEEWSAVLVRRLLDQGPDSQAWREGLDCLDELIEHVPAAESGSALPDALLHRLEAGLRERGGPQGSGVLILRGLRKLTAWMMSRPAPPRSIQMPPDEMPAMVVASAPEGEPITPAASALDEVLAGPIQPHQERRTAAAPPPAAAPGPARPPESSAAPSSSPKAGPPPQSTPPESKAAPPVPKAAPPESRAAPPPKPGPPPQMRAPPPKKETAPPAPKSAPPAEKKAPPPAPKSAPPPEIKAPPPTPKSAPAPEMKGPLPVAPPAGTPTAAAPAPAAAVPEILGDLLRAGRWFRVYEHPTQKMRWVKLEAYYPAQSSIVFTEFDGASPLGVNMHQFVDDLRQGLTAPTNPDQQTRALLAKLLKQLPVPQPAQKS